MRGGFVPGAEATADLTAMLRGAVERGVRKCRVEDAPAPLIGEGDIGHVVHMVTAAIADALAPVIRAERAAAVEDAADALALMGNDGFPVPWLKRRAEAERRGES